MAITEGRGGVPSLKSGQRVDGLLEGRAGVLAGVLDGEEQRAVVRREDRTADLRAGRRLVEQPRQRRGRRPPCRRHRARRRCRPPSARRRWRSRCGPCCRRRQLSGQDSQPFVRGRAMVAWRPASMPGWPATRKISQVPSVDGVVAVLGRDLDDVAMGVVRARVGRVDLLGSCAGLLLVSIDIDAAVDRVGLDVLRPVHRRGLQQVGRRGAR